MPHKIKLHNKSPNEITENGVTIRSGISDGVENGIESENRDERIYFKEPKSGSKISMAAGGLKQIDIVYSGDGTIVNGLYEDRNIVRCCVYCSPTGLWVCGDTVILECGGGNIAC